MNNKKATEHDDLPRAEAMRKAEEHARQGWTVYFKFTCANCDERVVLQDPNTLYEHGECCVCGQSTKLERVGFMLVRAIT